MAEFYAVLTGDLVRSGARSAAAVRAAQAALQQAVADLESADWGREAAPVGPLEIFRGDAWQLVLGAPQRALRTALLLRAALLAEGHGDTRVAIGIDTVARLDRRRPTRSTGAAFERSGGALDAMPRRFRMALAVAEGHPLASVWLDPVAHLCDAVVRRWRGRQAATVRLALLHPEAAHAQLAERLQPPVTQQAVSKALSGAGWAALAETLETLENAGAVATD